MAGKSRNVSISLDREVLGRFDGWLAAKGFPSRSSGVQHLIGEKLDTLALADERGPAVATVTYVYDHHRRDLMERLAHLQHEHLAEVVSSTHVHLDHARCLEVLILRGPARAIRSLGEKITATRGVERGEIVLVSASPPRAFLPHEHAHGGPVWHMEAHARKPDPKKGRRKGSQKVSRMRKKKPD
jgi:CopG family nickel-responsive transcriptional regulator